MKVVSVLLLAILIICHEDYYKLLGVDKNCNEQALKRAFKKLSLKYHPDKNKKNPEKAKEFLSYLDTMQKL